MPNLDLSRVGPLLSVVVANVAADTHRGSARRRSLENRLTAMHVDCGPCDEPVCDAAEGRWLRDQLGLLREQERTVMELRAQGRTLPETAAALGISYKAAESSFTRARKCLQRTWRATLGLFGVGLGRRLHRDSALGVAAVTAAAVFAVLAVSPDGEGGRTQTSTPIESGTLNRGGDAVARSPARFPTGTAGVGTQRHDVGGRRPKAQDASTAVEVDGVRVGPVRKERTTVTRERGEESLAQTLARCLEKGVIVEPGRIGCRG
jgi:hypothetical protein